MQTGARRNSLRVAQTLQSSRLLRHIEHNLQWNRMPRVGRHAHDAAAERSSVWRGMHLTAQIEGK